MANYRVIYDDDFRHVFEHIHESGTPVRFTVDKPTGNVFVNADYEARCLGYASLDDLKTNTPAAVSDFYKRLY